MFLGHFAAGLLASRAEPRLPLGTAFYLANFLGPPPPSVTAIAISMIVVVPILWWWGNRASTSA